MNEETKDYAGKYLSLNFKLWLIFSPVITMALTYDLVDKFVNFPDWLDVFLLFTVYCAILITFIKVLWIRRYFWPKK